MTVGACDHVVGISSCYKILEEMKHTHLTTTHHISLNIKFVKLATSTLKST